MKLTFLQVISIIVLIAKFLTIVHWHWFWVIALMFIAWAEQPSENT